MRDKKWVLLLNLQKRLKMSENKENNEKPLEQCPHCKAPLSSWEQVLLKVDRALVCKKCWYRISLPVITPGDPNAKPGKGDKK